MSTTPTELLETTAAAIEETVAAIAETTASTEAAIDIESIKEIMDGFDPAALLPDLSGLFGSLETVCRVAVMIGPMVLLVMGLAYLFLSPKEANYYFGYRTYFGMGSVHAWRFTQRLAGVVLGGLGRIWGSVIAATVLYVLPEALREFADYRMLVYAIVLILVMLLTNNKQIRNLLGKLIPKRKEGEVDG